MSDQYLGEIRMVGFNFAPSGWALCNGQLLTISQNTALFSLLGTYFGGNGTSNFALPNLQASAPMGSGNGSGLTPRTLGETGGEPTVTLQPTQLASHNHGVACMNGGGSLTSPNVPANTVWAADGGRGAPPLYAAAATNVPMNAAAVQSTGGNGPHNNIPPFLSVYFVIAMQGIYPSRG
ncbi:MAG: tail fiber protein [Candidatus Sulfotelmatobacter sp.]